MHMLIRAIVYANNKTEAKEIAEGIFGNMCGSIFDYYSMFNKKSKNTVSGTGRWGKIGTGVAEVKPAIIKKILAMIDAGKYTENVDKKKHDTTGYEGYTEDELALSLVYNGLKFQYSDFVEALAGIRKVINKYSDQELFNEEAMDENGKKNSLIRGFRYQCNCIGEYRGAEVYLYNNDGDGIRDAGTLKDVLTKWDSVYKKDEYKPNPYTDKKIYVVPADVHF